MLRRPCCRRTASIAGVRLSAHDRDPCPDYGTTAGLPGVRTLPELVPRRADTHTHDRFLESAARCLPLRIQDEL